MSVCCRSCIYRKLVVQCKVSTRIVLLFVHFMRSNRHRVSLAPHYRLPQEIVFVALECGVHGARDLTIHKSSLRCIVRANATHSQRFSSHSHRAQIPPVRTVIPTLLSQQPSPRPSRVWMMVPSGSVHLGCSSVHVVVVTLPPVCLGRVV